MQVQYNCTSQSGGTLRQRPRNLKPDPRSTWAPTDRQTDRQTDTHTHTHRQTQTQRHRQTDRQTDRDTHTDKHRHRYTDTDRQTDGQTEVCSHTCLRGTCGDVHTMCQSGNPHDLFFDLFNCQIHFVRDVWKDLRSTSRDFMQLKSVARQFQSTRDARRRVFQCHLTLNGLSPQ